MQGGSAENPPVIENLAICPLSGEAEWEGTPQVAEQSSAKSFRVFREFSKFSGEISGILRVFQGFFGFNHDLKLNLLYRLYRAMAYNKSSLFTISSF